MHFVTRLDIKKYSCVAEGITTDEVIITDERIAHIEGDHPGDYAAFSQFLQGVVNNPDYIIRDPLPKTALLLKKVPVGDGYKHLRATLRLVTEDDPEEYKNSIITFWKVHKQEYERTIRSKTRNKEILYKAE